jgi:hypothetical protein
MDEDHRGPQQTTARQDDAETGSRLLCAAMRRQFTAFEAMHRLRAGEGQVLLMDTGVRL